MARVMRFQAQPILTAKVEGQALASDIPLSFWGGFDPDTGRIIDQRHPLAGQVATTAILVLPCGRGSCSGSGVLLEAIRNHTAPAAILLSRPDPIICLGAILGQELYGTFPAILLVPDADRLRITTGDTVAIDYDWITVTSHARKRPSPCTQGEGSG
jgi:predicted aconitase with swiveling domain